jgi:glycosyltransferase involved in cell wall biosynthesis
MKFSVVIPTYNNRLLLRNTLEALNYQKNHGGDDYEVILVDDGSTDNTAEYIKNVNKNYKIKYQYLERDENSCRAKTRNAGWKNASGDIIAFIDSDIIVKNDYLSELERCFSISHDILVLGSRLMLSEQVSVEEITDGSIFSKYPFDRDKLDMLDSRYFVYEAESYNAAAIWLPWIHVYSCNLAIPRTHLESTGGFDENFKNWGMEDLALGYNLYIKNIVPVINSKLEVLHQYHGKRNDLIITRDKQSGYNDNIEYFLNKHPQAIRMQKKYAMKILKGDISDDKLLFNPWNRYLEMDFREKEKLQSIKQRIEEASLDGKILLVINDYVEDTDLDIWMQTRRDYKCISKYYPMSKRLDRNKMMEFLKMEKQRLKKSELIIES